MIKLSLTFAFLFLGLICQGQYRHVLISDTSKYKDRSFIILKTFDQPARFAYDYVIDNASIESQTIDTKNEYGGNNSLIVKLQQGVQLLTVNELLEKFNINKKYYGLPVYIDSAIIYRREYCYFQLSAVTFVKIQKDRKLNIQYISINSIHHINNPIADIYIRATYTKPKAGN